MDEERTHRLNVDLEDGAGSIEIFVTITGTTPLQEATNDGESSSNVALDYIPSKLTEENIKHYVCRKQNSCFFKNNFIYFTDLFVDT